MKKRTLFLTLTLTMAMSMTSLTGCGTQAKATYDENEEASTMEEEVIVANDSTKDSTEETESVENDIPSTTYGDLVVYNDAIKTDYEVDLCCGQAFL